MESQEPRRDGRNWVLLVVDVRHESAQVTVDEIGKVLVSDARHAVAHHAHRHARVELQPEEDTVEKGERSAERVADDCDGRRVVRREGALDGRENGPRGPVGLFCLSAQMRLTASLECILGLFLSETVVGFDGGWDSGEERRVERLEDEIGVRQVGEAGRTFGTMSAMSKKERFGIQIGAYIWEGIVPSCATMTVFNDGENPTYPV
jgi:hypothetical protein